MAESSAACQPPRAASGFSAGDEAGASSAAHR